MTIAVAAFLITGLQVGFHVSFAPLMPNLGKLNPLQGLGRMFAGQSRIQFGMNLVKMMLIGGIAWVQVRSQMPLIVSLSVMEFPANFEIAAGIIYALAWRIALGLLILALADWIYHKWKFERDIRMTKQEIKDEAKSMEGDQEIKGRRRQLARKMIMQRIHRDVPRADVVVTNPTELAIAMKYDPDRHARAAGGGEGGGISGGADPADRGHRMACRSSSASRWPRRCTRRVKVGQEVPAEFYQAIAEILAYVYELAGKGLRRLRQSA